jgi:hypothetical protein
MTHAHSPCALTLCAALSLAAAGCDMGSNDLAPGIAAAASAVAEPPLGHELFHMFQAEKGSAVAAELPAQF